MIYNIWMLKTFGAANSKTLKLLEKYGGAKEVYENIGEVLRTLSPGERETASSSDLAYAERIYEYCENNRILIITYEDDRYPALLRHISNPPALIFVCGNVDALNAPLSIAIVGTRNPSEYSVKVVSGICGALARQGVSIVSGMGFGIDSISHQSSAKAGGTVVGVLPCGVAVDYPQDTMKYRGAIFKNGGAVVSELLPGAKCRPNYFKLRNRIMSGLAAGVLLTEFKEKSGCHYTAFHAANQDRDIFCIPPHDITDDRYAGVKKYMREGAIPVFGTDDILRHYTFMYTAPETETTEDTVPAHEEIIQKLDGDKRIIAETLLKGAMETEILLDNKNLTDGYIALMELEADGIIVPAGGNRYKLKTFL